MANRVDVIRSVTVPEQWHYVSTKDNPADLVSRGVQKTRNLTESIWFHGPSSSWQPESDWPHDGTDLKMDMYDPQVKRSFAVLGVEEPVVAPRGGLGGGGTRPPKLSPRLIFQFVEFRTENGAGGGGG